MKKPVVDLNEKMSLSKARRLDKFHKRRLLRLSEDALRSGNSYEYREALRCAKVSEQRVKELLHERDASKEVRDFESHGNSGGEVGRQ